MTSFVALSQSFRNDLKDVIKDKQEPISVLREVDANDKLEEAIKANMIGLQFQYIGQVDSALMYHKKALVLSQDYSADNEEIGVSWNKIGIVHYYKGEIDSAAHYIRRSIPFFKDQLLKANGLNNLALMNKYLDNRDQSISSYLEALDIYKKLKDTLKQVTVLNNISGLHFSLDELIEAESYALKAKSLAIAADYKEEEMAAISSLANVCFKRREYDQAVAMHQLTLNYYKETGNLNSKLSCMVNLANCYSEMGEVNLAIKKYKLVLYAMDSSKMEKNKEATLINIASSYQQLKETDSVKAYYFKALNFSRDNKIILRYPPIYRGLSDVYREENNIDSSLYFKDLQLELRDSIDQAEKAKKVLELEAKYQNKELKGDVDKGKQELTQSERKLELFSFSLFIVLSVLMITVFGVVIIYKQYANKKSKLAELKLKADKKDIEASKLSQVLQEKENVIDKLNSGKPAHPYPTNLIPLTSREKEVLLGVKDGLKDQEIADKLFLSITTVRTHLRKAYVKIDVRNRAEAIAFISEFDV